MKEENRGFSLIELSIVITVIAILMTILIAANKTVKGYEIKKIFENIIKYQNAANAFNSLYKTVPGDMNNATTLLSSASANGNNDGAINGSSVDNSKEMILFWNHIYHAGLISMNNNLEYNISNTGRYEGTISGCSNAVPVPGFNVPYLGLRNLGVNVSLASSIFTYSIGLPIACAAFNKGSVTTIEMQMLDDKYDDGLSNNGAIRATESDCLNSTRYKTSTSKVRCLMTYNFKINPTHIQVN